MSLLTYNILTVGQLFDNWNDGVDVSHLMSANRLKLNHKKTELLWAGSRYNQSWLGSSGMSLQIDSDTVKACSRARCHLLVGPQPR